MAPQSDENVEAILSSIKNTKRREQAIELAKLMEEATGSAPAQWSGSIIGFGNYHYVYESGREGDTPAIGFAARSTALVIYGLDELVAANDPSLQRVGPITTGKGCVYIKDLEKLDQALLKSLVVEAYKSRNNS